MNLNEKKELKDMRSYSVVKSNELVQKNRFELSLTEQKNSCFYLLHDKAT